MLLKEIKRAVHNENISTLNVLKLLGKLENSGEHLREGFNSLYDYLTNGLKYSEGAATRRIQAARVLRRFPAVEKLFTERKVSLCTLSLVSRKSLKDNSDKLVLEISGKSKRQVEDMLALEDGKSALRETVRLVAVKSKPVTRKEPQKSSMITTATSLRPEGAAAGKATEIEERMKLSFSLKSEDFKLVKRARTLLSNKYPLGASLEELFVLGLREVVAKEEYRHQKLGSRKAKQHDEGKRYIPAGLKKKVFERDGSCCSFKHSDGSVCGSTWQLEIDHIKPFSLGGKTSLDNLRVCCRNHNQYLAKQLH